MIPRKAITTPAAASSGATHKNGTREMASITTPRSMSESPRVQFSQRAHHLFGPIERTQSPKDQRAAEDEPGQFVALHKNPARERQPNHQHAQEQKDHFDHEPQSALGCQHRHTARLGDALDAHFLQHHGRLWTVIRIARQIGNFIRYVLSFDHFAKMECLLSSHGVAATVRKNWLPFVPGPALAMESLPALE